MTFQIVVSRHDPYEPINFRQTRGVGVIPGAKFLSRINIIGNRLDGVAKALESLRRRMVGAIPLQRVSQVLGETAAGIYIKLKGYKSLRPAFNPKYHGSDDVVEDASGNLIIIEAKGGAADLGRTATGQQLSQNWINAKIRSLEQGSFQDQAIAGQLKAARDSGTLRVDLVETRIGAGGEILDSVVTSKTFSNVGINTF